MKTKWELRWDMIKWIANPNNLGILKGSALRLSTGKPKRRFWTVRFTAIGTNDQGVPVRNTDTFKPDQPMFLHELADFIKDKALNELIDGWNGIKATQIDGYAVVNEGK